MHRALALLALCLGCLPLGCVSFSSGGLFPEGRDRVHLEYFGNATFYRDVQFLLTEQVSREILSRPGLHMSTKDEAQVILRGRVLKVIQSVLSEDPNQTVTTSSTTITVQVEVVDALTGEVIKQAKLSQVGQFVPSLGEDLADAQRQAYRFLARDIVRELEAEF